MKKLALGVLVVLVLALLIPAMACSSTPTETVININAGDLYAAYDANEVAAANAYQGKLVNVTGVVLDFGDDGWLGGPYVQLGEGDSQILGVSFELLGVKCYTDQGTAASLTKGQVVTMQGRVDGYVLDVEVVDCTLQSKGGVVVIEHDEQYQGQWGW